MVKKVFFSGIPGQDGSYLMELLEKGYVVYRIIRRVALEPTQKVMSDPATS
jgi:GDP-D-mannose dehydratase